MCAWVATKWVTKIDYVLLFLNFIFIITLLFIRTSFVLLYIHIMILLALVLMQICARQKKTRNNLIK